MKQRTFFILVTAIICWFTCSGPAQVAAANRYNNEIAHLTDQQAAATDPEKVHQDKPVPDPLGTLDKLETLSSEIDSTEQQALYTHAKQQAEIELLKKEKELQQALLEQKKIVQQGLIGGMVLLAVLLVMVYQAYHYNRKQKRKLRYQNEKIQEQHEALEELNRTKDRLFSIISHDIKGPLNTLRSFVDLLNTHSADMSRKEIGEMSNRIGDSLQNLDVLLNNLLAWSRLQLNQKVHAPELLNLQQVVEQTTALYSEAVMEKQIRITPEVSDELQVWADPNELQTVIRNLVGNAVKFSYTGGEIRIRATTGHERVEVQVSDQGLGMDKQTVRSLFVLDKKVSHMGTANEKGAGFGLILCKELVENNGGRLRVESEPGKGSTFFFTLPVHANIPSKSLA